VYVHRSFPAANLTSDFHPDFFQFRSFEIISLLVGRNDGTGTMVQYLTTLAVGINSTMRSLSGPGTRPAGSR